MKNTKPQRQTSLVNDTCLFVNKKLIKIGAKNNKIVIIVIKAETYGRIFRVFTIDLPA
jgi:hypothetical protein